ncbi:MAG: UDP-N-acetylglucosamine 2-epimerase (non-hydrolyzing) [candidate division NC10 bacterium]|nr:UDP-N-acetylglucosamine 2-epimerase (non-hydrolyzing) [candidate division NC10 bacterium]
MRILVVAGARPNFVKVAPVIKALKQAGRAEVALVHTGQHYDYSMSAAFFEELSIPTPDIFLGVGSGNHGEQTSRILAAFEEVLLKDPPAAVVVVGDVNSTLACALAAAKCGVPLAHVEAGLRSFDRTMPEEINRVLTDALADYLFTHSPDADENLRREGAPDERIFRVGNVMIDTLREYEVAARSRNMAGRLGLQAGGYAVCTLHRPSNVDDPGALRTILEILAELQSECPIVFPMHPRTRLRLEAFGLADTLQERPQIRVIDPLGYLDFVGLMATAAMVLTDSGGVQEETTALGIPCLTLRECTERPVTVTMGTNAVVGTNPERVLAAARRALKGEWPTGVVPDRWDGHAADRIAAILCAAEPTRAPRRPIMSRVT